MSRVFMKGCEAIAEAAVRAGCRFFAGYPITPQNEIPEYFSRRMPEVGGVFVQGESEVASVNMVYGAASAGVRAMTSSSSPGIALKSEGISYCAVCDGPFCKGKPVAVVGGGDTALQDALFLAQLCPQVTLIHRRDQFRGAQRLGGSGKGLP